MVAQAMRILKNGYHLETLKEGQFVEGSKWKQWFNPCLYQTEVKKVIDTIQHLIFNGAPGEREAYLKLGDLFIQKYQSDRNVKKMVQVFDRQIAPMRPLLRYCYPQNQQSFEKWKKAEQPEAVFRDHPIFTTFLESSLLLKQMANTRDAVRVIDGVPALLVEGQWVKEEDLYQRFETQYSKRWERQFLIDRETRDVYTYLDNGKGLEKHHPYLDAKKSIRLLDDEEYMRTWTRACEFVREEEKELTPEERAERNQHRPFILQLVCAKFKGPNTNFHNLLVKPRHVFPRLIAAHDDPESHFEKGGVYEAGFARNSYSFLPAQTEGGQFVNPDLSNYKTPDEWDVTNIPISLEEARRARQYTLKYHLDGINLGHAPSYHITQQNCAVYPREVCAAAGITIPSQIDLASAIERIIPEWIRVLGCQIQDWARSASAGIHRFAERFIHPKILQGLDACSRGLINLIRKVKNSFIAFILTPIRAALGGFFGEQGAAFRPGREPAGVFEPPLRNPRNWFDLSSYTLNLPGIVNEWQLQQPSTVVYENPHSRFPIVPPV